MAYSPIECFASTCTYVCLSRTRESKLLSNISFETGAQISNLCPSPIPKRNKARNHDRRKKERHEGGYPRPISTILKIPSRPRHKLSPPSQASVPGPTSLAYRIYFATIPFPGRWRQRERVQHIRERTFFRRRRQAWTVSIDFSTRFTSVQKGERGEVW